MEVQSLRQQARDAVASEITPAARKQHERNYEKLHVYRDGKVQWFEAVNRTDDLTDHDAPRFQPIKSVITVGTGSFACNCEYCNDKGYVNLDAAIRDAVLNSDLSDLQATMAENFDAIYVGYFDDEELGDDEEAA